jgi:hypothetical protein
MHGEPHRLMHVCTACIAAWHHRPMHVLTSWALLFWFHLGYTFISNYFGSLEWFSQNISWVASELGGGGRFHQQPTYTIFRNWNKHKQIFVKGQKTEIKLFIICHNFLLSPFLHCILPYLFANIPFKFVQWNCALWKM